MDYELEFKGQYETIPGNTQEGLRNYVERRMPVGDFLTGVLENDLRKAVCHADSGNLRHIHSIVLYVLNQIPATCHGSPEKVTAWLDRQG